MPQTYIDGFWKRKRKHLFVIIMIGSVAWWWIRSSRPRRSPDAWTQSILEHLAEGEPSREGRKEQMKQAFRLMEATNHQKKDMLDIYRQQVEDLGAPPTNK